MSEEQVYGIFQKVIIKYRLKAQFQIFPEYHGFYGPMHTFSIYNDSGCFTIHHAVQRNELSYYTAGKYSNSQDCLMEKIVNPVNLRKELYYRLVGFWGLRKNQFKAIAEILDLELTEKGRFYDLKVSF